MAEILTPTTRLEAVNSILASIGETPTTSLDAPVRTDVIQAEAALNETNRMVQNRGWYWNTEEEYEITADNNGDITFGSNVLRARVSPVALDGTSRYYIFRNSQLYNRKDRTYTFTAGYQIKVDQVVLHPFEELPDAARIYIWTRAGVIFQARHLTAELLFRFTEQMAQTAWANLLDDELYTERFNLDESGALRDLVWRR